MKVSRLELQLRAVLSLSLWPMSIVSESACLSTSQCQLAIEPIRCRTFMGFKNLPQLHRVMSLRR